MKCSVCGKESLMLYEGERCKTCFNHPPKRAAPDEKQIRNRIYNRDRMRKIHGTEIGEFIIEWNGKYKCRRFTENYIRYSWAGREKARVYESRGWAETAVRMAGRGRVVKL